MKILALRPSASLSSAVLLIFIFNLVLSACVGAAPQVSASNEPGAPVETGAEAPTAGEGPVEAGQAEAGSGSIYSAPVAGSLADGEELTYAAQSGDSLGVVARRFGVEMDQIASPDPLPAAGLLTPGQLLLLPATEWGALNTRMLLPDSEVVNSPSAVDFDIDLFLREAKGFLGSHYEYLMDTDWSSAADVIERVTRENSINPRLIISLLEHECHCVYDRPASAEGNEYLLGVENFIRAGMYLQFSAAAGELSAAYYGWRSGQLTELRLADGSTVRLAPDLNAGSVAVMAFFAHRYGQEAWEEITNPDTGFAALHARMFGDPWQRAGAVEPLLPGGLVQPEMNLPFEPGKLWSLASGPHAAWEETGALAALDFAPAAAISGCIQSDAWVTAVGDGLVLRSELGYVVQDLGSDLGSPNDSSIRADGLEQTGWVVLYLHLAELDRVPMGTFVHAGDILGHPSCEGGRATGTHLHIARKYNGEWILAGGALPFTLSGWVAQEGARAYEGTLTKDGQTITAHPNGALNTTILLP